MSSFIKQTPLVLRDLNLPEISWQRILDIFDEDYRNDKLKAKNSYGPMGFRMHNATRLIEIDELTNEFNKIFFPSKVFKNNPIESQHLYMSLSTDERSYGNTHYDGENVIFWQLCGKSEWTIFKKGSYSDEELVAELSPGDIIFCPQYRNHKVKAITPRCGASLGFGKLKEDI
jgi:hypothetical protein